MSIGWAVLGTGVFPEEKVVPALHLTADSELIAVMSRDAARAEEFAAKHHAKVGHDSMEAVLGDSRVDAVYIANRNHLHAPSAILALHAGKHVLMEKPIALNSADGMEVVKAAESRGVRLGVGFELRQHPGRIESKVSPLLTLSLNSAVLPLNWPSSNALIPSSNELILSTSGANALSTRSFFVPKIFLRTN